MSETNNIDVFGNLKDLLGGLTERQVAQELEQLEQIRSTMPTPAQSAYIGTLFAPGSGVADVAGELPSFPTADVPIEDFLAGEPLPSLPANIEEGRYLDAFLQSLGATGDAVYAAPAVGPLLGATIKGIAAIPPVAKGLTKPAAKGIEGLRQQKIQEDEEDLKRRLLELNTINNGSYKLNNALFYKDAINIIMDSISKVIRYDICSVIVTKFSKNSEIFLRIKKPIDEKLLKKLKKQSIDFIKPFDNKLIDEDLLIESIEKKYYANNIDTPINKINSFTNIPLKFNDEVIGLMSFYAEKKNIFKSNEISFLNTLSNQLSATLGKLNVIKKLEKSKISSLILSMADPVIFYDNNNHSEIYNESAKKEFNLPEYSSSNNIKSILDNLSMQYLYNQVEKNKTAIKNQHININDKTFTVNISPVNYDNINLGIILVFRDITELQKVDRIKTQRLEAIEKVNKIIEHIQNLNQLLSFLMNYLLDIANSQMGSIQLIIDGEATTKVHSNFPDKVNKHYQFKNSKTISQTVIETKKSIFIENYFENNDTNPNVKILIDSYICIPIIINKEIIGIVNIARKFGSTAEKLSEDDIKTLTTLTNLSGTAILNALYFESKQKTKNLNKN